jgi:hypothetical protein
MKGVLISSIYETHVFHSVNNALSCDCGSMGLSWGDIGNGVWSSISPITRYSMSLIARYFIETTISQEEQIIDEVNWSSSLLPE